MAVHVNNERELAKMGLALDPGDPNRLIRLQDVGEVQPMSREKMRCESFDNDAIDNLDPAVPPCQMPRVAPRWYLGSDKDAEFGASG